MTGPCIALVVAYDGSQFSGFARQDGDIATVQGRLERALSVSLRRHVGVVGAGRTDAGVHALGQVVSFESDGAEPPTSELLRSVNALAGPGISVRSAFDAPPGFSARFDAQSRQYVYRIASGQVPPVFLERVAWWIKPQLDLDAMRQGAAILLGEHDFKSFCVAESAQGKRTVRRLDVLELGRGLELGEDILTLRVVGNAFLHSMVRVIVGTLVEVGAGRQDPAWVSRALEARSRAAAGPTAPAHGLTLWSVRYPDGKLSPRL